MNPEGGAENQPTNRTIEVPTFESSESVSLESLHFTKVEDITNLFQASLTLNIPGIGIVDAHSTLGGVRGSIVKYPEI